MKAYEKGSMTVVEATQMLWAQGSRAWLVMAGPSMMEFERFMKVQPGPMPRLVNLPAFADEEKRDLLAAAAVVAQPSRVESLGLVMLEAAANGKPVVAADIEVSRRMIADTGAGVVVPFGDGRGLAEVLQQLLEDAQRCDEIAECGRAVARAYEGNSLWVRNAQVLEETVARSGAKGRVSS